MNGLFWRNVVINFIMVCLSFRTLYFISENVGRLKKLDYLNLALNNIERIENLEGKYLNYMFNPIGPI